MQLIEQVASDEVIEQAFLWICLKERTFPQQWCLEPQKELADCQTRPSETVVRWNLPIQSSAGNQVWKRNHRTLGFIGCVGLKVSPLVLTQHLKPHISNQCVHVKGNGDSKEAVRQITGHIKENRFVFRCDVKDYYWSAPVSCTTLGSALSHFI